MIAAPTSTLAEMIETRRGGLGDLVWLVLLETLGAQLTRVVRAVLFAIDVSLVDGLLILLNLAARALLLPLGAALVGALVLRVALRVRGGPTDTAVAGDDGAAQPGRSPMPPMLDVAGLCAVPVVVVRLLGTLVSVSVGASLLPAWGWRAAAAVWVVALVGLAWRRLAAR